MFVPLWVCVSGCLSGYGWLVLSLSGCVFGYGWLALSLSFALALALALFDGVRLQEEEEGPACVCPSLGVSLAVSLAMAGPVPRPPYVSLCTSPSICVLHSLSVRVCVRWGVCAVVVGSTPHEVV